MKSLPLLALIPLASLVLAQEPAKDAAKKPEEAKKEEAKKADAKPDAAKPEEAKKEEPKRPEPPPEFKAYSTASSKADPVEKIAALEAFEKEFPKGNISAITVRGAILDTILKEWPGDEKRIQAQIKSMLAIAKKDELASTNRRIANSLLTGGVDFGRAEKFARKGLSLNKETAWITEQKAAITKRKGKMPTDEEFAKRYREQLASYQTTLGEILYKEGRSAEAEKYLKLAYDANQNSPVPMRLLATLAERRKDTAGAFDYMVTLRLSGRAEAKEIKRTEELFAKVKGDSSESLEEYLDNAYQKKYPNPVHAEPYKSSPGRTDRAVLAEVFTGAGCPPCVAADLAFDVALERYARRDVVVLMYHQHIPRPDPMTNPATLSRAKFYKVGGVPSFAIDGKLASGGGSRSYTPEMWQRINPDIEKRLELAPAGKVQVNAALEGSSVKVKASAEGLKTESKELTLQVALVEETLRYSGENGVRFHPMVVRGLGGPDEGGFKFDPAKPSPVEVTFDLAKIGEALKKHLDDYEKEKKITFSEKKSQIDRAKLGVVAFVQDEKSKEILQSVYVKLDSHGATD
ncbi:MAG TPA: hypothetical protein VGP79_09720 [Bryobacteraceae bacterium]|nr:hypothetical protein [Bryobacteraceae bacterium]